MWWYENIIGNANVRAQLLGFALLLWVLLAGPCMSEPSVWSAHPKRSGSEKVLSRCIYWPATEPAHLQPRFCLQEGSSVYLVHSCCLHLACEGGPPMVEEWMQATIRVSERHPQSCCIYFAASAEICSIGLSMIYLNKHCNHCGRICTHQSFPGSWGFWLLLNLSLVFTIFTMNMLYFDNW